MFVGGESLLQIPVGIMFPSLPVVYSRLCILWMLFIFHFAIFTDLML